MRTIWKPYIQHGLTYHPSYRAWQCMLARCYNPANKSFKDYGGRGIAVCESWRTSPVEFCKWADETRPSRELFLDREDNDLDYSPENCRWVPVLVSNRNRRNTFSEEQVSRIKQLLKMGVLQREIALAFSCSKSAISSINISANWATVE